MSEEGKEKKGWFSATNAMVVMAVLLGLVTIVQEAIRVFGNMAKGIY